MEQHAVPQDITGFKFKLVGDMTLKQFGELAGGALFAYLFYASNLPAFFKWPLVTLFGLFGFALAFLPIEERPLDVWIINFIKAIYQPTLYLWKKKPAAEPVLDLPPLVRQPEPINPAPYEPPVAEPPKLESTLKVAGQKPAPPPPPTPPPGPLSIEDLQKLRDESQKSLSDSQKDLEEVVLRLKGDLYKTQQQPKKITTVENLGQQREEKITDSEMQMENLMKQNNDLNAQIETIKTKIAGLKGMDSSQLQAQLGILSTQREAMEKQINDLRNHLFKPPPPAMETVKVEGGAQVRVVDRPVIRQATISLTDIPNIINGTVQSDGGVPLDGTILIVKDKSGNSIRALKSNKVGQFIASTPLENGTYYLEFEKEGYTFDVLEIALSGQVMPPLEIISKNGPS